MIPNSQYRLNSQFDPKCHTRTHICYVTVFKKIYTFKKVKNPPKTDFLFVIPNKCYTTLVFSNEHHLESVIHKTSDCCYQMRIWTTTLSWWAWLRISVARHPSWWTCWTSPFLSSQNSRYVASDHFLF